MKIFELLKTTPFNQQFVTILFIIMSIQIVPIEGFNISPIKVSLMGLCLCVFLIKVPYLTKVFWISLLYFAVCFLLSYLRVNFRFSTLGYQFLFLITFVTYYNFIYSGTLSLQQFQKILKFLIIAYAITLIIQQCCVLVGMTNVPIFNLMGFQSYKWNRLPVLTCEPSHAATILTGLFLGYLRCIEISNNQKPTLKSIFEQKHRIVTISYLWLTFTMGSGSGWIGFCIICLYFINWKSFLYITPLLFGLFLILQYSENEQFQRAKASVEATLTGDVKTIAKADGSASVRIIPLVNTLTHLEINKRETWLGEGTNSINERDTAWKDPHRKISTIEQYGLIGFICSLILLYTCIIKTFFSCETICFILLLTLTISNAYLAWSVFFTFTTTSYFYRQKEKGLLILEKNEE